MGVVVGICVEIGVVIVRVEVRMEVGFRSSVLGMEIFLVWL